MITKEKVLEVLHDLGQVPDLNLVKSVIENIPPNPNANIEGIFYTIPCRKIGRFVLDYSIDISSSMVTSGVVIRAVVNYGVDSLDQRISELKVLSLRQNCILGHMVFDGMLNMLNITFELIDNNTAGTFIMSSLYSHGQSSLNFNGYNLPDVIV